MKGSLNFEQHSRMEGQLIVHIRLGSFLVSTFYPKVVHPFFVKSVNMSTTPSIVVTHFISETQTDTAISIDPTILNDLRPDHSIKFELPADEPGTLSMSRWAGDVKVREIPLTIGHNDWIGFTLNGVEDPTRDVSRGGYAEFQQTATGMEWIGYKRKEGAREETFVDEH